MAAPPATDRRLSHLGRLAASLIVGAVGAALAAIWTPWQASLLFFWVGASIAWVLPVWVTVLRLDAEETRRLAGREDPRRATADTILLTASMAALAAVVLGILKAAHADGSSKVVLVVASFSAIAGAWGVVHTVFTLRYADLYYRAGGDGVDFHETERPGTATDQPVYADFAYMAFTIGMTYQVSDTDLTTKAVRHTALRHALLSYVLGTVIIAATINLAAGLVK